MTKTTLKLLKRAIAHWWRMANGKSKRGELPEGEQCDLCVRFMVAGNCTGCPVKQKTGENLCADTPFHDAWSAYVLKGKGSAAFKAAAKKELAFLKSLLPKARKR